MSGFLDRLAARHTAPTGVRPRSVSRFEPATAIGTPGPAALEETMVRVSRLETEHGHEASHSAVGAAAREDRVAVVGGGPRHAWDARPAEPGAWVETRTVDVQYASTDEPRQQRKQPAAIDPQPMLRMPDSDALRPVRRPALVPSSETARGRYAPFAAPGPRRTRTAEASREPDVVQVRIGRIEVRAITPATKAPQPRSAPTDRVAPLPLDRYLAEGRRA